jgi:hypothetical protein
LWYAGRGTTDFDVFVAGSRVEKIKHFWNKLPK